MFNMLNIQTKDEQTSLELRLCQMFALIFNFDVCHTPHLPASKKPLKSTKSHFTESLFLMN